MRPGGAFKPKAKPKAKDAGLKAPALHLNLKTEDAGLKAPALHLHLKTGDPGED